MSPSSECDRGERFDFGLTETQEQRALVLHQEGIIVDLLSQHAGGSRIFSCYSPEVQREFQATMQKVGTEWERMTDAEYWPYEMSKAGKSHLIRDWYQSSGLTCGTYGISVDDGNDPLGRKLEIANSVFASLPWVRCVTAADHIRQAKRDGVIALYAHWQPVNPIPRNLAAIDRAYAQGLRSLMLTYNRMDNVGVGCTERVDAGLSMFGVDVVRHCNDIGLIVDVSHCGHMTTLDACRHSKSPVNANHTAAQAVYTHARAKSDEELCAIAQTGGVIGVVAVPAFITDAQAPSILHVLDHVEYIADLVGWQHVAIGTDWPLQLPQDVLHATFGALTKGVGFRPQDRLKLSQTVEGFSDVRDLVNFTRGLVRRRFLDEEIRGVMGENALRVFDQVWRS